MVIFRYNTGMSVANGRSLCLSCGNKLSWYELIPLGSFIAQGGKCRSCKVKISPQYPLVEFATGVLFALVFWKLFFAPVAITFLALFSFGLVLTVWALLVVIFVYDLRHKIIPDALVFAFIVLGFIQFFLTHPFASLDLFAGPILFIPFFLMWYFSSGRWMGLGDGKLAIGMGAFLGLAGGITSVVLGFWIGAGWSLLAIGFEKIKNLRKSGLSGDAKQLTMKSEIPFAPFLIIGLLATWLFSLDFFHLQVLLALF